MIRSYLLPKTSSHCRFSFFSVTSASCCLQWTSDQLTWQLQPQLLHSFYHTSHQPRDMIMSECPSSTHLHRLRWGLIGQAEFMCALEIFYEVTSVKSKTKYLLYVRGGAPTHCGLWQVTQYFWVFDSSLVKRQVTVSMLRQSISSHRFEWECLLSLIVWAVDFHQGSVSGLPCSQFIREVCVCVWRCSNSMAMMKI